LLGCSCGSGTGIRFLYILGSGSGMGKKSGSGINIPYHFSGSLETVLELKILIFFDADPESGIFLTLDSGSGMEKFGSGINIPDL
jgi:hypothetical protein